MLVEPVKVLEECAPFGQGITFQRGRKTLWVVPVAQVIRLKLYGIQEFKQMWRLLGLCIVFRVNRTVPLGWSGTIFRVSDIFVIVAGLS